jgi:hypothetical protein
VAGEEWLMARATFLQTSFNGGEWSPLTYGRADLSKYKNALALCLNYVPTLQGSLTRRPGTRFVAETKGSGPVRLVKFEFSITQAYVLEFGDQYIRFYANEGQLLNGGVPYEINTPYLAADLWNLSFVQSADTLYIAHVNNNPRKLQRFGATNWVLTTIAFQDGPYLTLNTTTTTLTPSGTSGTVTITASSTAGINNGAGFLSTDVGRLIRLKQGGVWLWCTIQVVSDTTHCTVIIAPPTGAGTPTTATAVANMSGGSILSCTVTNGGSGYGASPPAVTISGGGGTGATAYTTLSNGVVISVTMSVTGSGYAVAPAVTIAPPTPLTAAATTFWRMGVWGTAGGFPSCVCFNQDRLIWAGALGNPNRIDGSQVSDYENMSPTNLDGTVTDDCAIGFSLNANTVNAIRWMVSDEWGLLCGTAGGEWVVTPSSLQQAITPTNINAKLTTSYGSANVAAIRIGKSTLFIQRTGRKLREMTYQYIINTFQAPDISLLSEHLTATGVKQMTVTLAPYQLIWMVTNQGALIGITYDKDQDAAGWHQHQIGGWYDSGQTMTSKIESVAGIPSPDITHDDLWMVVNRTINGATKRYVEVLTKFWEDGDNVANGVFVDSSAAYANATTPVTTISGLTWLVGQTVGVLANGATHPDCVVDNSGTITLQRSANYVQVGLKYRSQAQTMRIEAGGQDGPAQGKLKRIHRVIFRFFQTIGHTLLALPANRSSIPEPFRDSSAAMDWQVALYTGDKRWAWEGSWDLEGQIYWVQDDPLPSNVLMVAAQLETQDGG